MLLGCLNGFYVRRRYECDRFVSFTKFLLTFHSEWLTARNGFVGPGAKCCAEFSNPIAQFNMDDVGGSEQENEDL